MKIVLCLNHFMPQHIAGTEVYTWALSKSLQEKGHQVTIVIPNYDSTEFNYYEYDTLSVKSYPEPNRQDRLLVMGKRAPDGIDAFGKLIEDLKPDIVHIQELAGSSGIGIYHLRLLKKLGVKIIFTMHLAQYSCFCTTLMYKGKEHCRGVIDISRCTKCALSKLPINNLSQDILYNFSMPLYKANINAGKLNHAAGTALSYPFIIKNLRTKLDEIADLCNNIIVLADWYKSVLLQNGITENKLHLVKQALPYKTNISQTKSVNATLPVRLIFIGRIDPIKGLDLLLEAIESLPEDKIVLDIFGSVKNEPYFINLKNKTKGKSNIFWRGLLAQADVVNTIREYDALILPSVVAEMSPLVIQEAFAAGVPVIGTNVPGIAEQVEDRKNGMLFKFKDVSSLKSHLIFLMENPLFIYELKENIVRPDNFETVVDQMISIYDSVMTDSRKGKTGYLN